MEKNVNWQGFINGFGRAVLRQVGIDLDQGEGLPVDYNPITRALRNDPEFISRIEGFEGFYRNELAKLATVCQMVVYDYQGGPDGDQKPKMIRRHWYAWFKTHFAQPFAEQLGDYEIVSGIHVYNDLKWTKLLSVTLAWFVDEGGVTYQDLWVKDDSRMVARLERELFQNANIIVAVEKDSLFNDVKPIAQSLGARVIISGRGKNSKAATEKILRDFYGWRAPYELEYNWNTGFYERPQEVFGHDKPLVILHLSDYDFDGEAVIGPTFGEQARRYTPDVLEARIGIQPRAVSDLAEATYQVKVSNKGYVSWAKEKAIFLASCGNCGEQQYVVGELNGHADRWCPTCGNAWNEIRVGEDPALGLEVEALPTNAYRPLIVDALLQVMDFWYIVQKLREEATADAWQASEAIMNAILNENEDYQELLGELERYERLEQLRQEFQQQILDTFYSLGSNMEDLYDWQGDDPEVQDFVDHVANDSTDFASPWRPFDRWERTQLLTADMGETFEDLIQTWADTPTGWKDLED